MDAATLARHLQTLLLVATHPVGVLPLAPAARARAREAHQQVGTNDSFGAIEPVF